MDKNEFVNKVSRPQEFSPQDRGWLKAQLSRYPFSSVVRTMALLADHAYGYDTADDRRATALSLCNATLLDAMLSSSTKISNPIVKESAPAPSMPAQVREAAAETDILNEINTFHEVSFKTAPKSVILSNFLQNNPAEEEKTPPQPAYVSPLDEKKSLRSDVSLGTETLAVILEQQGKLDKALAIYKNLLARNPEKSSIFAPRIKKLEQLINSK